MLRVGGRKGAGQIVGHAPPHAWVANLNLCAGTAGMSALHPVMVAGTNPSSKRAMPRGSKRVAAVAQLSMDDPSVPSKTLIDHIIAECGWGMVEEKRALVEFGRVCMQKIDRHDGGVD